MRPFILCLPFVALPVMGAAQPLSQSMAQCAGLVHSLATMTRDAQTTAKLDALGVKWRAAAIAQAEAEGRPDPAGYVAGYQRASYDDWRGRGKVATLSQDFRDWTSYCRALAKARDIKVG